jgi:hypothetical protein
VHHDLELVREMMVDVDLNETLGIAHHAEHRMMRVVVVGKSLAADENQRLLTLGVGDEPGMGARAVGAVPNPQESSVVAVWQFEKRRSGQIFFAAQ